jgi:DMSO/TMAO reductase YedYZ molybdopterin-dependent catalytic subunit
MMFSGEMNRRNFIIRLLQGIGMILLTGCDNLSRTEWFPHLLGTSEGLTRRVQRLITPRKAMAREFTEAERSETFPTNGNTNPDTPEYAALLKNNFSDWKLIVNGLVQQPATFTLSELRQLPSRTQITRHDCVEGWSAIAKWKGVQLGKVLERVHPLASARYVVLYCADPDEEGQYYYESMDLEDAYHPQTLLAYDLNDLTLPVEHGAPIRLRLERQLGYKMAKYVMRIELVESFKSIEGGKGGYWEDQGYEWYAGI